MNKNLFPVILGLAVIAVVTAGVSFGNGMLTVRWGASRDQIAAAEELKKLPLTIGKWQSSGDRPLDEASVKMLKIQDSYVCREYRNTATGAIVYLTLMVGQTGRITVHTPEVCFGGKDYEKKGRPEETAFPEKSGEKKDTFWKLDFDSGSLDLNRHISFYYAVNTGEQWQAVKNPRRDFRGYRYVYKLQAEAHAGADLEEDSVRNFLTECLPEIQKCLLPQKNISFLNLFSASQ